MNELINSLAIILFGLLGLAVLWFLIIESFLNALYCFFSYSGRIKRWEGYYGFLYVQKPLITKTGARMVKYCHENGIDLITEYRKGTLDIPREYLEPTEKELGAAFDANYVKIYYWIHLAYKSVKSKFKKK